MTNFNNNDNLLINYIQNIDSSHRTLNMMINVLTQQERNINNLIGFTRENYRETRRNNNRTLLQHSLIRQPAFQGRSPFTIPINSNSNNRNRHLLNNSLIYTTFNNISNPINNYCPITHDNFNSNDNVIQITPCRHIFSRDNLLRWFETNTTCPMCRHNLLNNNQISNRQNTNFRNRNNTPSTNNVLTNNILNILNELNNVSDLSNNITNYLSGNITNDLSGNITNDLSGNITNDLSGNSNEISFLLPLVEYNFQVDEDNI